MKNLNECSSCINWKSQLSSSKERNQIKTSSLLKTGLCIGGGFDGSQTQFDETCSMWKPLIDKERVQPIFHDGGNDY